MRVTSTNPDPYVVVRRFINLHKALAAKAVLDASGMDSYLADEETTHLMGSHLGGVRLFVRQSDAQSAEALLNEFDPHGT